MTTTKTRTALYGGSFNPIHLGHLAIARQALKQGLADEVWLMVSPQNPLKAQRELLGDTLRLQMARRATEGISHLQVCDYEFGLPRPSYTYNTLLSLDRDYPDREFLLLIGGDNWAHFSRWYRAADIIASHRIIVYPRRSSDIDASQLPPTVSLLSTPLIDISSTMVRQTIAAGGDISHMVPPQIVQMANEFYSSNHQ